MLIEKYNILKYIYAEILQANFTNSLGQTFYIYREIVDKSAITSNSIE